MAMLNGASASPTNLYNGTLGTTSATVYTAPAVSTNVTGNTATAYIKEIIICNSTSSTISVNITINGTYIIGALNIPANDVKILTGLNTMLEAGYVVAAWCGTTSACALTISGVEVQ